MVRYASHLRYLLRALLCLAPLLALWWTLLLPPLLAALRISTQSVFRVCLPANPPAEVAIKPGGNWYFSVPVPQFIARRDEIQRIFGRTSPTAPFVKVRSLKLEVPGGYVSLFTVTLPFFWAMVLASRWTRRMWRTLAIGTAALFILAVPMTVFEVVKAFLLNTGLVPPETFAGSFLRTADFAALSVIPFLAPIIAALVLDRNLSSAMFPVAPAPAVPARPVHARTA